MNTDRDAALLPCPFCGGEPHLVDDRMGFFVRCTNCKPYATVIYGDNVRYIDHIESDEEAKWRIAEVDFDALRQSAIAAWNRRAPTPSAQAEAVRVPVDVEAMLEACVPGGSICDPQSVADSIRAWFAGSSAAASAGDRKVGS